MFPDVLGFRKKPPLVDVGPKCYSATIDYIWIIYKLSKRVTLFHGKSFQIFKTHREIGS